jgi:hypothetical protein
MIFQIKRISSSSATDEKTSNNDSIDNLIPAEEKTLKWQQFLAILYKNIVYWKLNWISLLSMFQIVTMVLLSILIFSSAASNDELTNNKVSMANLLNPQVLLVAGTSRESPEMRRLIESFKQNVERDHGKFIELQDTDMNDGKKDGCYDKPWI